MNRAQKQIDRYRKGTALIQVKNHDGQVCAGAHISVEQETHQFLFGCVVPELSDFSADDRERYHRRVQELFNVVCCEDHNQHAGDNVLTVDLRHCRERMHLAQVQRELDRLNIPAAQGKPGLSDVHVYVSGRTLGSYDDPCRQGMGADDEEKSAQYVAGLYTLCFSHPSVRGVFWCGMSDREEGVGRGGLLRRDLAPKYAHKTLRKLIHVIWHTRVHGETDALGQFRFHGFFGTYRVVVTRPNTLPAIKQLYLRAERHENRISLLLGKEKS